MADRENDQNTNEQPHTGPENAENTAFPAADAEDLHLLEKYSSLYTGTFAHTLDGKGRMVIPQAFREQLGGQFTIAPEFDFKSVAVYPEVAYVRMRESYDVKLRATGNAELRKYLQWLDAYTFRGQECDGQGRVLLPARLRQVILGEDKDVDIMGSGDHLRVAVRAKSEQSLMDFIANIDMTLSNF